MSEFIFIVPAGWTEIPYSIIELIGSPIGDWININNLLELSEALKLYEAIPAEMNVYEAKFFNGEVLVVKLG